jgi:hypothetical protein
MGVKHSPVQRSYVSLLLSHHAGCCVSWNIVGFALSYLTNRNKTLSFSEGMNTSALGEEKVVVAEALLALFACLHECTREEHDQGFRFIDRG